MELGTRGQILAVGAAASRAQVTAALERQGYTVLLADGEQASHAFARWKVICVLADAALADTDRATPVGSLIRSEPDAAIVLLSDNPSVSAATAALRAGAADYLAADDPLEHIVAAVESAVERQASLVRERTLVQSLKTEVACLATELRQERRYRDRVGLAAMESLVCVVEAKDLWLAGHSVRVAQTAASVAAQLGRDDTEIEAVRLAGRLHDIGMVGVRDHILSKEGSLTPEEFEQVRAHVTLGSQILAPLPGLGPVVSFVRHHHERCDGEGYPDRLKGEAAPWGARVIGVAEIYDAMTTRRPYRETLSPEHAVQHMQTLVGTAIGAAEWEALAAVVDRREALVFVVDPEAQGSVGARAAALSL